MKKYFWGHLAIAASLSLATVSCTPPQTISTTPIATATATTAPTTSTASATPSPTLSSSAKPSESPTPAALATAKPDKAPDVVRIAVVNNSGKVLKAIYMSAPKKEDWGENELDTPLQDREKADFEWKRSSYKGDDSGCVFDIKAEYNDGKIADLDPIDVCKTPAINLK